MNKCFILCAIFAHYNDPGADGFIWRLNDFGRMAMYVGSGGTGYWTIASDRAESTGHHYIRVTKTNGIVKLWRKDALTGWSWAEVSSYSDNQTNNKTIDYTTDDCSIGGRYSGGFIQYFNGRIGYFKMVKGTSTFAYEGFYPQNAIYNLENHGFMFSGEQITGMVTYETSNNSYDQMVLMDGQNSALVDSYTQRILTSKSLTKGRNCNVKIGMNRVSSADQSHIKGIVYKFGK